MSEPAAPWWADVQHLRPREDRADEPVEPRRFHTPGRASSWTPPAEPAWTAPAAEAAREPERDAAVATLEHDLPNPWLDDEPQAESAPAGTALWDDGLEEAFARTPSWSDDEDWLLPKGADRIENGRRTIEIRGQVDRVVGVPAPAETAVVTRSGRRRPSRRPAERLAGRPDRIAMWAFLLGVLLIVIAALSSPGDAAAATHAAALLAG